MSLLDQLMQSLGPNAVQQMSTKLGADTGATSSAVSAALPVLLGALARNASSPDGANALSSALTKDHDGSALDDVSGAVHTDTGIGSKILAHVLGNRQPAVAQGIGQASGLDAGKTAALLAMLAPLVMGALGKAQRSNGLDAGGLASMLGQERQRINTGPAAGGLGGLMGMLDRDNDGSVTDDVMGMAGKLFGRK